jgi:glutaredoxin 3
MFIIYSQPNCEWCTKAKQLLFKKNLPYVVRQIGRDITKEQFLEIFPDAKTVPQIMDGPNYIGGYDALEKYFFIESGIQRHG